MLKKNSFICIQKKEPFGFFILSHKMFVGPDSISSICAIFGMSAVLATLVTVFYTLEARE